MCHRALEGEMHERSRAAARLFIPTSAPYSGKENWQSKTEDDRGVRRRTGGAAWKGAPAPAEARFLSGRTRRETVPGETDAQRMEGDFRKGQAVSCGPFVLISTSTVFPLGEVGGLPF